MTSSLLKVLGEDKIGELASTAGAEKGDAVLIVAGTKPVVAASLGALRNEVARRENLIDRTRYEALIVTEFPMFEHDEETDRYLAAHHPFTSPMDEDLEMFRAVENDAAIIYSDRYGEGVRRGDQRIRVRPGLSEFTKATRT